ncbi:carboxymuconolactone decarboxylase family protein [Variovorax soli]|uniref:4-carboxymuconolactone decarboxylase n=1 Tax=Variovorax soli TaxID=376815 RepID=A0ABU1NLM2_9BURK|nr:carboxymuconolactone decarboxylase family protein [Variovorax soli]MDR6539329.1 4-carboxymuconolactone decarboxylase [Variovorax soli]
MFEQGHSRPWAERLQMPAADAMSEAQRKAAQALIDGPRKGVFGPFIPLLQSPVLMERIGNLGEYLRFDSQLDVRVRELVTCVVAREVGNQFEWLLHAQAAIKAGVNAEAIEALRLGRRAAPLAEDEQLALDFALELLRHHGVSEPTYAAVEARFGKQIVVELSTLVGYFVMVCWVMNVAHTPGKGAEGQAGLEAFPL